MRLQSSYVQRILWAWVLFLFSCTTTAMRDVTDVNQNLKQSYVQFDIKVLKEPEDKNAEWLFKVESFQKVQVVEIPIISDIRYNQPPVVGDWRTFRIDFYSIVRRFPGIDLKVLDKILIFPTWGAGKDAVYRIDNVFIGHEKLPNKHIIFDGSPNIDWPGWDCCGRSTPKIVEDDDPDHDTVFHFEINNENRGTVLGFNTQATQMPTPFNINSLLKNLPNARMEKVVNVREVFSPTLNFNLVNADKINSIGAIYSIIKDDDGFMWFGGSDGLARFDGYQLKIFRHNSLDASSISNNMIWDLLIDSQGRFWVATDAGLNLFDRDTQTFTHVMHDKAANDSISNNIVKVLFEDSRKNIWVGTYGGLNRLNADGKSFQRFMSKPNKAHSISDDIINAVIEDSDGLIWVATNRGLNRYDYVTGNFRTWFNTWGDPNSLDNERVRSIYEDTERRLWVGTFTGLNSLDLETGKVTQYHFQGLKEIDIGRISADPQKRLWLAAGNALVIMEPDNQTYSRFEDKGGKNKSFIGKFPTSLYFDDSDNWWLGTFPDGINYVERNRNLFTTYQSDPSETGGLSNDSILTIEEDESGNLWLGTDVGGIDYLDRKSNQIREVIPTNEPYDSFLGKGVLSATLDKDNLLWIGLWEETVRIYNPSTKSFQHQTPQRNEGLMTPNSLIVWTSRKDSKGNMWFGTLNDGLIKYDIENRVYLSFEPREDLPDSFGSLFVWSIFEDSQGRLWFGTSHGLELYISDSNEFRTFSFDPEKESSLSNDNVLSISEDLKGNLWVGTRGGGLNKFDVEKEVFTDFTSQDGLPDNVIAGILTDNDGYLWLSTFGGLCRFDTNNNQCMNFTHIGGLKTNKFNIGAAKKLSTGELAFGGTGGFTIFDPREIAPNNIIPPVVLTDLQIANESVQPGTTNSPIKSDISQSDSIVLDHTQSMFSFEFAALDFQDSSKNEYAYLLQGYDKSWNEIGNRRRATYTNLDYGSYVFHVIGSNSEGVWNREGVSVNLTLLPPPWKTWWAYTIYTFVCLTVLVLIIYLQIMKLQERKQLKLALWASGDELWNVNFSTKRVYRQNPLNYLNRDHQNSWLLSGVENSEIHPDDKAMVAETLRRQQASEDGYLEVTYRAKTKQGDWVWLQDRGMVTQTNAAGELVSASGTTKNIQRLKFTESELKSLNKELEQRVHLRTKELEKSNEYLKNTQDKLIESEKMAGLGTVVVGVSHELNTPVGNAIMSLSSLQALNESLYKRVNAGTLTKSYFKDYRDNAFDSMQLTNSSLQKAVEIIESFKKISVLQNPSVLIECQLRELIIFAVSEYKSSDSPQNRSDIKVLCSDDFMLVTYPDVLKSILIQLIENACTHAVLSDDILNITITAKKVQGRISIVVKDDGKGMSEEDAAQLFDPFFTTDRGNRVGLGMFVVYNQINHLFKGTINYHTQAGKGSSINIFIPEN